MKRHFYFSLLICFLAMSFVACKNNNDPDTPDTPTEDYVIRQFPNEPYLGEVYISDYDYAAGNKFLIERYKKQETGACSSFRNGDFAARNLDWFVRNYAVLVVHIPADSAKHRLASVGIVSSNPLINREMIASGEVKDVVENWRKLFPIFTTDGINEYGLCVNTNIVLHEDSVRKDYKPCKSEGFANKTSFVALPRFILDNCKTCEEAITECGKLHLTQAESGALAAEDSHIMVSDMEQTVILEWYNDKMVVTKYPRSAGFKNNNMPSIMTNFYNCKGIEHVNADGSIKLEELLDVHPYAMGVERYETIRKGWAEATTDASVKELIKRVNYTNYFDLDSKWYTENSAECGLVNGTWYYPDSYPSKTANYLPANSLLEAIQAMYSADGYMGGSKAKFGSLKQQMENLEKGIDAQDDWYTELTSIYDIKNHVLQIMPQEGWYNNKFYKFTVFGNRGNGK